MISVDQKKVFDSLGHLYLMSMLDHVNLYIQCIEELIVRVKNNIKEYTRSGVTTKISAYADDTVGYLIDDRSIEHFFDEFEKWGIYSGARLNKKNIMKVDSEDTNKYENTWNNLQ